MNKTNHSDSVNDDTKKEVTDIRKSLHSNTAANLDDCNLHGEFFSEADSDNGFKNPIIGNRSFGESSNQVSIKGGKLLFGVSRQCHYFGGMKRFI